MYEWSLWFAYLLLKIATEQILSRGAGRDTQRSLMDHKSPCTLCCESFICGSRGTGGHDYKPLDVFARFVSSIVFDRYSARRCKFMRTCVTHTYRSTFVSCSSDSTAEECTRDLECTSTRTPDDDGDDNTATRARKHSNERFLFPSAATTTTSAVMEWQLHSRMDFSQWMSSAMCCDE